jgi:hypothetical protein
LLLRLATEKSHLPESNQRPTDYKSVALPTELKWLTMLNKELTRFIGMAKVDNKIIFANFFELLIAGNVKRRNSFKIFPTEWPQATGSS